MKEGTLPDLPRGRRKSRKVPSLRKSGSVPSFRFDAGFYRRFYIDPATRVASRADALRLGRFVCAFADYLGFRVLRVLDAGCGLGHLRGAVRERFPKARYVGLETSAYLCRRFGWVRKSVADYAPRERFDLVFCHDVLQYLDDRVARRALANLARLSRGALYFSVLTAEDWRRNADRGRTDFTDVRLRPAAWYRARLARQFRPLGGGVWVRRGYDPLLWELERP